MVSGGSEYPFEKIRRLQSQLDGTRAANRRLNRRCQSCERELTAIRREVSSSLKVMKFESGRAHRYANVLRDIYQHHDIISMYPWMRCPVCKFRRWFRFKIWNRMFAMKEPARHTD